eukprot:14483176-Alexandrium_andersonii.AAC.1
MLTRLLRNAHVWGCANTKALVTLVNQHMRGLRIIWAHRAPVVQPTRDMSDAAVLLSLIHI